MSLVLRSSEPAYKASLAPVQDLTKHVSSLTTCATLYDAHGLTLAKATRGQTADLLEQVQVLAQTLAKQYDPSSKEYLYRTGAVHAEIEKIRKGLPADNSAAVQQRMADDRDMLADCLEEVQEMAKEGGDEDDEEDGGDDLDDWDDEGLQDLGLGKSKPMSAAERQRAKQVSFALVQPMIVILINSI